MDGSKLLVFCETKRGCDTVTRQLRQDGWPALAIHGDKSQQERDWVLAVSSSTPSLSVPYIFTHDTRQAAIDRLTRQHYSVLKQLACTGNASLGQARSG